jgi:hypothetical protein
MAADADGDHIPDIGNYDLFFTGYIDAVQFPANAPGQPKDIPFLPVAGPPEIRRPVNSDYHMNWYESIADPPIFNAHGEATDGLSDSYNFDFDHFGNTVNRDTHQSIQAEPLIPGEVADEIAGYE